MIDMTNTRSPKNKLYILDITPLKDEQLFEWWYSQMPSYRQNKIDAFKPRKSKLLSLGAGMLLKKALEDIGITEYEIELGENEKPYLRDRRDVFFNISHSGDMVILGISDREIGVDIEQNKEFKDSLINYVFSGTDFDVVKELFATDSTYTRLWTTKESIMKHSGKGISIEPKAINLMFKDNKLMASSSKYDCSGLNLLHYEIGDYQITVCSSYGEFELETVQP